VYARFVVTVVPFTLNVVVPEFLLIALILGAEIVTVAD
jgi:hypothetical protein